MDGRLYTGFIKRWTKSVGLHSSLKSVYWGLEVPRLMHRVSTRESIVHDINGTSVEFPLESYWQYQRFRWMHPEIQLFEELTEELQPGDVFYDVGAHLGWHAVVAASVDADVDVVAFEPHPDIASRLSAVLETTGHDATVEEVALYDSPGTVEFTAAPEAGAQIAGARGDHPGETISVETVDGDSLMEREEIQPPDILKVDAEGAEAAVLRGLERTIDADPPRIIYCEIHEEQRPVTRLLEEYGYEWSTFKSARPLLKAVPE